MKIVKSAKCFLRYLSIAALLGNGSPTFAAFPISQIGCSNPSAADFDITALFSHTNRDEKDNTVTAGTHTQHSGAHNLIRFDFLKNGDDFDIFYGGFEGVLYRYNSQNKQVTSIKNLNTIQGSVGNPYKGGDHGLTGIAFHPNFEKNRWLFLFYTPKVNSNQNRVMRLSRFELTPAYQLQNEKVLLSMEASTTDSWHSGGDMYFTAHGDLFLQVGDNVGNHSSATNKNSNAAWVSGNTASLVGSILRIHPDSSSKGYSVPKGNFGEHFASTMGVEYADPTKVKPEVFTKGMRSNFTSTGHPTKLVHIWGEVNSNSLSGGKLDEFNVVHEPVYGGWPHYQGNATSSVTGGSNGGKFTYNVNNFPELSDAAGGSLLSSIAGVTRLPKPYLSDMNAGSEFNQAMAHALYYYGKGDSIWEGRTFPPNFHETFLINSFAKDNARIIPLIFNSGVPTAELKNSTYDVKNLFTNNGSELGNAFRQVIEAKYGPDGALYVLSRAMNAGYSENTSERPGLMTRIDYTGNCQSQALFDLNKKTFENAADSSRDANRYRAGHYDAAHYDTDFVPANLEFKQWTQLQVGTLLNVRIYDLKGRLVQALERTVSSQGQLPVVEASSQKNGVYLVQYADAQGAIISQSKQVFGR